MTRLHQAGFTLIELMVAITLGLLITAAAIQLYLT
ncbi:prepilin-type N-terminal cleavage/methylation domain-containing protein, partial [uncultured Acinetobacter sp.]